VLQHYYYTLCTAELRRVILESYPQLDPEAMRMQAPWHGDVDTDNLETILDHI
jgi:flavorubredoxin